MSAIARWTETELAAHQAKLGLRPSLIGCKLTLPWPPSLNNAYANTERGRVKSEQLRRYKRRCAHQLSTQQYEQFGLARLKLCITLHPPTTHPFDIDNRIKALADCLQTAGVFNNDNQIDMIVIERAEVIKDGLAIVEVSRFSHV